MAYDICTDCAVLIVYLLTAHSASLPVVLLRSRTSCWSPQAQTVKHAQQRGSPSFSQCPCLMKAMSCCTLSRPATTHNVVLAVQAAELKRALEEARLTAEAMQDRAESAEEASAAARAELARQSATNRTLLSKLASSRVS